MHTTEPTPSSASKNEAQLADVARRLALKEGRHEALRDQTIARWVNEAAAELAGAPVQTFVPILVEHTVRLRINAVPASTAG